MYKILFKRRIEKFYLKFPLPFMFKRFPIRKAKRENRNDREKESDFMIFYNYFDIKLQ